MSDVAWDSGEGAVKGATSVGTGMAVTIGLGMAEGATFAGAAVLTSSAMAVAAPVAAGIAATWVASKGVRAAREAVGGDGAKRGAKLSESASTSEEVTA